MFPNEIGPRLIQDNFDFWKKFDNQKMNEYHDGIDFMMLLLPESEIPSLVICFSTSKIHFVWLWVESLLIRNFDKD